MLLLTRLFLVHLLIESVDATLHSFLVDIMSCLVSKPTIFLQNLKQTAYCCLYILYSTGVSITECLRSILRKKVTDILFIIIICTLNM